MGIKKQKIKQFYLTYSLNKGTKTLWRKKKIVTVQITFSRTLTECCFALPALLAGRSEIETISLSAEVKNTILARQVCQLYANVIQQK